MTMILDDIAVSIDVLRNVVIILLRKRGLTTRHLTYEGQLCSRFFIEYLIDKSKQESSTQKYLNH